MLRQRRAGATEQVTLSLAKHGMSQPPQAQPQAGRLRSMFIPSSNLVPEEYWQHRGLTTVLGLISTAKAALTAQAHMIAIGVGDASATPLNYLLISETNSAISRFVGLALSAHIPSSYFAMHAKRTLVLNATVGKIGSAFPVLLLLYPAQLQWISLAQALFNACMGLLTAPANAALNEHHNRTPDPAQRAHVGQINQNQDRLRVFAHMIITYYAVFVVFAAPATNYTYVWVGVLLLGLVEAAIEIARTLIAAPVTFNRTRFRLACEAFIDVVGGANNGGGTCDSIAANRGGLLAPKTIAWAEPVLWPAASEGPWGTFALGASVDQLLILPPSTTMTTAAALINRLLAEHEQELWIMGGDLRTQRLTIVLKQGATAETQLKAAFHAFLTARRQLDIQTRDENAGDAAATLVAVRSLPLCIVVTQ